MITTDSCLLLDLKKDWLVLACCSVVVVLSGDSTELIFFIIYIFLNLFILGLIATGNYGLRSMSETFFVRPYTFTPAPALLFLCRAVHAAAQGL
jgi:hypothetical protein